MSATSTIWPLTTIFTPPASCQFSSQAFDMCTAISINRRATLIACHASVGCYPTPFETASVIPTWSPGVCPSGYYAASSTRTDATGPYTSLCCQNGLNYVSSDGLPGFIYDYTSVCYTTLSAEREYGIIGTLSETQILLTATALDQGVSYQNQYAYQSALTVVWASSDLSLFHPPLAPILASLPASNAAKTTSAVAKTSSSLSTGAEVGISVGVALAVLAAATILAFWMLRRRRRRPHLPGIDHNVYNFGENQQPGDVTYIDNHAHELCIAPPAQLQAETVNRHEVYSGFEGYEMSNEGIELTTSRRH